MKVEVEMGDPETMALIAKVLEEFDPNAPMDEDEAMFTARFTDFEQKSKKSIGSKMHTGRTRAKVIKKVPESYHIERKVREAKEEKERLEKEMRQA